MHDEYSDWWAAKQAAKKKRDIEFGSFGLNRWLLITNIVTNTLIIVYLVNQTFF